VSHVLLRVFPELLFAYHGRSLLVTDRRGEIGSGLEGLYERDLRLLSRYRLLVHGRPPRLDAISTVDAHSTLAYYVCPPRPDDGGEADALGLSELEDDRQVVVRLARFVGRGLHEVLDVANHGTTPARLGLAWELAADFADLVEARAGKRQQRAPVEVSWRADPGGGAELRFEYRHPDLPRGALVRLTPIHPTGQPPGWDGERIGWGLELAPQASARCCLTVSPIVDRLVHAPLFGRGSFAEAAPAPSWRRGAAHVEASDATLQRAWDTAVADLADLALGEGASPVERGVPAAGQPLYGTLFGRDALTVAGQALMLSPEIAEGALRALARLIGVQDDDFFDEQPGRVPQQVRDSPLALLGLTPWRHDYGDYAAPCAFLVLLGGYHIVTGDTRTVRELLEPARRVLAWLEERADLDGDGFLEYKTRSPKGQRHQGWKDSGDAVVDHTGRQVEPPVASCELQGYWYAARLLMAEVYFAVGETTVALGLLRRAGELKRRFDARFWLPEERFYAFGLDAAKRPIRSISSNVGHCLATGIVPKERAAEVVRRLMAEDMFSGWGIRTLSADNPAYNPLKYHLGSVWPSENATIAFGMKRYGFAAECNALCRAQLDAAALFEHHRLPETFGGHRRDADHPHPGLYPDSCAPQAWSASAVVWFVQAMLGLWSYAPLKMLFVDPTLPEWLPALTLREMRVGDARVSLRFERGADGATTYRVVDRDGAVRVLRQSPPSDVQASAIGRLRDLAGSLLPGH
jgi:glycogen debranching enzyme